MTYYAIDFESYYDKEYGIEECGVYGYLHDQRFDPYLMSVWGKDVQWVGHPKDLPKDIEGKLIRADAFIAHNAGFDRQVWKRCVDLDIFRFDNLRWYCTANMSVYLGGPRSLKDAAKQFLGVEVSKEMRNYMKGRTWAQAVAEGKAEKLMQYALDDSKHCYELWIKYNGQWPDVEREIAEITFKQTQRGVSVNTDLLDKALPRVKRERETALKNIPWVGTCDEKGEEVKPLASKALKAWLKRQNLPIPVTTEAKNPEFMKWQEEHKDVKVVKAMQTYRSTNAMTLKAETLRSQVRPDGRYGFDMKYFGATTGRWSAGYEDEKADGTGFNIQNVYKETLYGLNLREALCAGPGKKFVISDYSQIEPRCLAWLCNDQKFLDAIRAGIPLYEAHAIASMGWKSGEVPLKRANAKLYALAKARVLALGYGAGWAKFIFMAKMYGAGECLLEPITDRDRQAFMRYIKRTKQDEKVAEFNKEQDWTEAVNAWKTVMDFRASNEPITNMWETLERDCRKCSGTDYVVELPSGRKLPYFNVKTLGGIQVQKTRGDVYYKIWGGFLTENVTQATARDVMRDAIINLERAGIATLFTVHDEIVCEVDRNFPKEEIRRIMNLTPEWIPGLPLEIEQEETDYYKK